MMREINVTTPLKKYPIKIESEIFNENNIFKDLKNRKVIIVTDGNIAPLYGEVLLSRLHKLNVDANIYIIPAGESSKSHKELIKLYDYLSQLNITRNDYIIALGGGVTGDLAGFAASTYLRGLYLLQIPTSLLAMVDSSVGGKVAVNLPTGKNLVGSFYHPQAVIIDPEILKTLPNRHFADGMAEVIKYGCIRDSELFVKLEAFRSREEVMENIEEIIYRCCLVKKDVVEKDERENGLRMILNFGHTFGHAIEKCFEYKKYTHGEAIAMGMVFISQLSRKLGLCTNHTVAKIKTILSKYNLPTDFPRLKPEEVFNVVVKDKKIRTNSVNLVLIQNIGSVTIQSFSKERIGGLINEMLEN